MTKSETHSRPLNSYSKTCVFILNCSRHDRFAKKNRRTSYISVNTKIDEILLSNQLHNISLLFSKTLLIAELSFSTQLFERLGSYELVSLQHECENRFNLQAFTFENRLNLAISGKEMSFRPICT